jgi:hypothetical protein
LNRQPKLLLLPAVSGIALALIALIGFSVFEASAGEQLRLVIYKTPLGYGLLFAAYFICTLVILFFNAALVFCALQCFAGKAPSMGAELFQTAFRKK